MKRSNESVWSLGNWHSPVWNCLLGGLLLIWGFSYVFGRDSAFDRWDGGVLVIAGLKLIQFSLHWWNLEKGEA